ncbi:MAG: helix-turn-helix domain-containing protein [Chloroflexi bacterium]|nr:helix-turn-helix domain-containing protein [Chloroflexota bacterium]MDA1146745.1 helix-turn-helix domain-containing protein [Chloroflexota bacterium]MQC82886.1 helix-turn-helix domain-containing protein [Chloroflexota bacterium]
MTQPNPIEFPSAAPGRPRSRTIGARLEDARLSKQLSFEEVERDTRISRRYLEALERGHYEIMPAPVYARGFMRSYADYLGLDPAEAVMSMPAHLPVPEGLDPMPGLRRMPSGTIPPFDLRLAGIVTAIVLVIALLLWIAPRLGGGTGLPELPGRGGAESQTVASSSVIPPFDPGTTPDFVGADRATAIALIENLGLTVSIVESPSATARAGEVFQQAPEPGTLSSAGDVVTLVVSQGPPSAEATAQASQ